MLCTLVNMYWRFRETCYPNLNLNPPDYLTSHPQTEQVIWTLTATRTSSQWVCFAISTIVTYTIKQWINRMINVIFLCPDCRLPTIFTWDHTRSETSSCDQYSPCLLPVSLQRKVLSVSTYVRHYDQFRYNIKLQQKVMTGYVCKVMTEYGQDSKIPCHASKFAPYVVNCNVMTPSNRNTTPERKN
jgi:hypothetical protein